MSADTPPRTDVDARGPLGDRRVQRVGYGAMQLERAARHEAIDLLRRALELGVDHVDTAHFYKAGHVNEVIGAALAHCRDDVLIATKVGATNDPAGEYGLSPAQRPEQLRAEVEANLRSLGVDRIDLVNLRRLDGSGPGIRASGEQVVDLDDQLAALADLRRAGTIGHIGLSNVTREQLRRALPVGIACVQNHYNLLDRAAESVLDECRAHDIAWVPFFPLGSGVTTHPVVRAAAERTGASPAQVGLAWLLGHARQTLLIPGTTNVAHLEQNLRATHVRLDADTRADLDGLGKR
ncbi:aldo/keto reductase [Saccharomonospora sp. CUA-673]|uniref:aldo/keto reductase n=1 Tax=Saccharomonospora sp. CUA-673 TaxID=1904969 RepID=UPI0009695277|nr:aldo/keto reductase [Saccharomonospora sp. CUA-673]OLT46744.1 aldo/keto reductase [Saccharomonospora sp. CUA-673]